ncbi:MAG TPA: I78 family peptidase inhibitor [Candidatus Binatia bacterium]|nr:I78 family peptidase inhibitor [Candidatus Binatia bacterium]
MLRIALVAAVVFAACASATAEEQAAPVERAAEEQTTAIHRGAFVVSGDECGASRYSHLLGEQYAELHHAALPTNSNIVDRGRLTTLEYTPARLNVVVNGAGRIIAIGCF